MGQGEGETDVSPVATNEPVQVKNCLYHSDGLFCYGSGLSIPLDKLNHRCFQFVQGKKAT